MSIPDEKGVTLRQHLEQLGKEEDAPPFPYLLSGVWDAYLSVSAFRKMGFSGPDSLSPSDILGWCKLTGRNLSGFKLRAIMTLDATYMRVRNG